MNNKTKHSLLAIGMVGAALITGLFMFKVSPSVTAEDAGDEPRQDLVTVTIDGQDTFTAVPISAGDTVLDVLRDLNGTHPEIQLITKDYAEFGTLIYSLYGAENGTNGKYWLYKVNGVLPPVGADKLELQPNDVILWEFGESAF